MEKIVQTLKSNGFPEKRVSLPTDKMYAAADNKGLSFNSVLEQMEAEYSIEAQIGPEKIIFSKIVQQTTMDTQELMRQAQEMMAKMDPAELKRIQDMFANMAPEEKEEIIKKGKDLGII